jgi:methyl-accepting chemotaxis protein
MLISWFKKGIKMNFFYNLPVYKKIGAIVIILTVLLAIVSIFGLSKVNSIAHEMKTVQSEDFPLVALLSDVTVKQLEKSIAIEKALRIAGISDSNDNITEIHHFIEKLAEDISVEIKQAEEILVKAKKHAISEQQAIELKSIEKLLISMEHEHDRFEEKVEHLMKQLQSGAEISSTQVIGLEKSQEEITHHLETLLINVEKMTEHALETVVHGEESAFKWMIILSSASIFIGILVGVFVTRSITNPLAVALKAVNALADGDLTIEITSHSKDELGQLLLAMERMKNNQKGVLTKISESAELLSMASEEVAVTTTQSSKNIEYQRDQLNQSAVAMNEMTATVQEVARNATEAATASADADEGSKQGLRAVEEVNISIMSLAEDIDTTKAAINILSQETDSVHSILDVITGIAEQTNLLALNAAIEAARAGEQGRGFAVVADEVRSLAGRTQESIATIQQTVTRLKAEAKSSVDAMQAGHTKATQTIELSHKAEQSLNEITSAIASINDINLQIASAAEQQSAVAEQMNMSIIKITEKEDENATGAEQVAVTTREIAKQAEELKSLLTGFKVA